MTLSRSAVRVALITGAAQGIGKAIALRLASDGFKIALNDVDSKRDQLADVAEEIHKKYESDTRTILGDVSDAHDVESMVEVVSKHMGSLDVMVANAGISGPHTPIISTTEGQWNDVLRINAKGVFLCYKYAAKQMIAQGRAGGRIIGASSIAGQQGLTHLSAYAASKFAVRGLTQVAAMEFGHHGITVNAYAPGAIDSPMAYTLDLSTTPTGQAVLSRLPSFSTLGKVEDVASLVSYLASQESRYITGQTISVNGGLYYD
ncbi:NAD-binding protein [Lentinula aciculospora]|uniref:NAD-binding protein n=1 Tax=Lentinula aciculospora TaxID=153920 RepID=A0A9W9DQA1_9AGAR|nr:NAD-binding protein [Lentinula aciculospora]